MNAMMDRLTRIAPAACPGKTRFNEIPLFKEGLYDLGGSVYAWMVPNGSWGGAQYAEGDTQKEGK